MKSTIWCHSRCFHYYSLETNRKSKTRAFLIFYKYVAWKLAIRGRIRLNLGCKCYLSDKDMLIYWPSDGVWSTKSNEPLQMGNFWVIRVSNVPHHHHSDVKDNCVCFESS